MKQYTFQNTLISKKQLKQILSWSFTNYGSIRASFLADKLKFLGFHYSTKAGISISIEDLKIPSIKNLMLKKSNYEILKTEKRYLYGKITEVERFQKIIDTWNITSETLKDEVVSYFKNYDPLNSVYMMAFSGARGNLSQVRQLVGMRGLMSDPSGGIMDSPIKQNFREGLTITDYLMSGYGARKGIVDTSLKTANSGYLTRRLIDVAQDIIIREKDCRKERSIQCMPIYIKDNKKELIYDRILGRILSSNIYDKSQKIILKINTEITSNTLTILKQHNIKKLLVRSSLTCGLNQSICQNCYGWNLANENLINLGEAIGIIAGQSIGEPGTQLTMRTFHTGGIFTSGSNQQIISSVNGILKFSKLLKTRFFRTPQGDNVLQTQNSGSLIIKTKKSLPLKIEIPAKTLLFVTHNTMIHKNSIIGQVIENSKQTKFEKKDVLSKFSGEIYSNEDRAIWIFNSKLVQVTKNAFFKFSKNLNILNNSFIWRTKIIQKQSGFIQILENKKNKSVLNLQTVSNPILLKGITLSHLISDFPKNNAIINILNAKCLLLNNRQNQLNSTNLNQENTFGSIISNKFNTTTGGIPYFLKETSVEKVPANTFLWLSKETYLFNKVTPILQVENSEYVTTQCELTLGIRTKNSGLVEIIQENNTIQEVNIRPGILYQIKNYKQFNQKIFYPGEIVFNNNKIHQISLSEIVETRKGLEILIRPISLYQVPKICNIAILLKKQIFKFNNKTTLNIDSSSSIRHTQNIQVNHPLNLIKTRLILMFEGIKKQNYSDFSLTIKSNSYHSLKLNILEKLNLSNYIPSNLKNLDIISSLIIKNNQFINSHSTFGYIQRNSNEFLQLIKIKIHLEKYSRIKRLVCITQKDCLQISEKLIRNNTDNILLKQKKNVNIIGRIIAKKNGTYFIQQGQPYFFPSNTEIFCKNGDLVEIQQNIGQLNFEKEITGDIVQGLPKIEQILEGRKVKWKPSKLIDEDFLLCSPKLSLSIFSYIEQATLEGHMNLMSLLKIYFNWYLTRLSIFEASYRSIKKIQRIILDSIQSVYRTQGVEISDKHLEVIIKRMTAKVKVIFEGNTPLLPNEILDLHQIEYINTAIIQSNNKIACYEPILFGITKASLNSNSFISSASFQETTRVLTKAAIEGKIDWLRGLKENIIIGGLIPAGTGFQNKIEFN